MAPPEGSLSPEEVRLVACWLARWPPGLVGWVRDLRPHEARVMSDQGVAAVVPLVEHAADLHPVLRLAIHRHGRPTDAQIMAGRDALVRFLQEILHDATFTARDLAAAVHASPHALAVRLVGGLKEVLLEGDA